jgi:hypothetical protein
MEAFGVPLPESGDDTISSLSAADNSETAVSTPLVSIGFTEDISEPDQDGALNGVNCSLPNVN